MKSFQQFKEDMNSVQNTMKDFAGTMVPQMKKFGDSFKDSFKNSGVNSKSFKKSF